MGESAHDQSPAGHKVISSYKMISAESSLEFPERNAKCMLHKQNTLFEMVTPSRFVERRSRWTGSGVQDQPFVAANKVDVDGDGNLNAARRHGPTYPERGGRAYLIDLGEIVDTGTKVSITTTTRYIDELGQFQPFLSHDVAQGLVRLQLSVAFRLEKPERIVRYTDADGVAIELPKIKEGDLTKFQKDVEHPKPGIHKIAWDSVNRGYGSGGGETPMESGD